jgi:hypothetical protein
MAAEPSLDVLQREASESPRSLLLPPALLAQRRAVIRATLRMDEGSKLKINTLIVKYPPNTIRPASRCDEPTDRRIRHLGRSQPVSPLNSPPPRDTVANSRRCPPTAETRPRTRRCEESLKVPPGRRSRRNLLPLLMFADSALASYALSDVQKVHLAQCMTLETYAPGSYGAQRLTASLPSPLLQDRACCPAAS